MKRTLIFISAGTAIALLPACAGGARDPGINDSQQDEFRVITKAPLTVPPDYALRPPQAGVAQPMEVDAERVSVTAFGSTIGQDASEIERALVAAADANAVSPVVRAQVDYEQAGIIRKSPGLTDRLMFWRGSEEELADARADTATGGQEIEIERKSRRAGIKLPGT